MPHNNAEQREFLNGDAPYWKYNQDDDRKKYDSPDGQVLTKALLEELYWNRQMSTVEISRDYFGNMISPSTVYTWMKKYGIRRRTPFNQMLSPDEYDEYPTRQTPLRNVKNDKNSDF
jgi:hypothetical protein